MNASFILGFYCPDKSGIQSKVSTLLYSNDAFLTDVQSYSDRDTQTFFSRIVFSVTSEDVINKINFDPKELSFYRVFAGIENDNVEISRVKHSPESIKYNFNKSL